MVGAAKTVTPRFTGEDARETGAVAEQVLIGRPRGDEAQAKPLPLVGGELREA